jgi:hypothetical protein
VISLLLSVFVKEGLAAECQAKSVLILKVLKSAPLIHYDTDIHVNVTRHINNVTVTEQIVVCPPSNIEKKCFVLNNSDRQYSLVLPVFELD